MKCIFCLIEKPPGYEHVFPSAIGGTLTTARVCDSGASGKPSCNSTLGSKVDAPLTDHLSVLIRRSELKLSGHSGKIPDGVSALLGEGGVLASDHSQKIQLVANPQTGVLEPRLIYNKKTTELGEGSYQHQITVDASIGVAGVRKIMMREIQRARRLNPNITTVPSDQEIEEMAARFVENAQTMEKSNVFYQIGFDLVKYRRGILKIAYELAFLWLGEEYLKDPLAAKLRAVVLDGLDEDSSRINATLALHTNIAPLQFWQAEKNSLLAYSCVCEGKMAIVIKIFDVISGVVTVSEKAIDYTRGHFDPKVMRFVHIDPVSGTQRQSSLADELGRVSAQMRAGGSV